VSFLPMNDRGSFRESNVKLDTTDSELEGHDLVWGEVMLLEFLTSCDTSLWTCSGLVLRWSEDYIFTRIGVFDFDSYGDRVSRKNYEPSDVW